MLLLYALLVSKVGSPNAYSYTLYTGCVRRLWQTWDVATGALADLPFAVYASLTCLTLDKNLLLAAAIESANRFLSAVFWNLRARALVRQIRLPLQNVLPMQNIGGGLGLQSPEYELHFMGCTPPDSELLVVGCAPCLPPSEAPSPVSELGMSLQPAAPPPLATFIAVDLTSQSQTGPDIVPPNITFDANPSCIVLKPDFEAIVGLPTSYFQSASTVLYLQCRV